MLPARPPNNVSNCHTADSKFSRQSALRGLADRVSPSNFQDSGIRQFGVIPAFSARNPFGMESAPMLFSNLHVPFTECVLNIVGLGSEKKMSGIDATWIVASRAIMANKQTIRNQTVSHEPRKSVGTPSLSLVDRASRSKSTVTVALCIASPDPATIGLLDVAPEKFDDSGFEVYNRPRNDVFIHIVFSDGRFLLGSGCRALNATANHP